MTSSSHVTLKFLRLTHLYLGVFAAPALLFFAFTGAMQTFSLHEATRGSTYTPPRWAVVLSQIHKKQTPVVAEKKPPTPASGRGSASPRPEAVAESAREVRTPATVQPPVPQPVERPVGRRHHPLPLKIFFLVIAISLASSSFSGIYMSYKYVRNKLLVTALLALGAMIPVALLFV